MSQKRTSLVRNLTVTTVVVQLTAALAHLAYIACDWWLRLHG